MHGENTDWITRGEIIANYIEARVFESFDRCTEFEVMHSSNLNIIEDLNINGDNFEKRQTPSNWKSKS